MDSAASTPTAAASQADREPDTKTAEATNSETGSGATRVIFEIVPDDSKVRFYIDEVLNNAPKTVIGETDQVAGEIAVYPDDPSSTIIGPILVNARTLTTDNDFRNRAIKNRILYTDDYEFIAFTPTEIVG